MTPETEKQVLGAMSGVMTANQIRHATGLPHEQVYAVLVALEAQGRASLRCHLQRIGKKVSSYSVWSAA